MSTTQDSFLVILTTCGLVAIRQVQAEDPRQETLPANERLLEIVTQKPDESFLELTVRVDDASRYHAAMLGLKPVLINGSSVSAHEGT